MALLEGRSNSSDWRHWIWIAGMFVIGIALMLVRINVPNTENQFQPIEIDLHAERVETSPGAEEYVELTASTEVTVDLSDESAALYFVNPEASGQNVVLSLNVEGESVGKSGLLPPGNLIQTMSDLDVEGLELGSYAGSLVGDTYDPDTGERHMVNFEIDVDVTVVP